MANEEKTEECVETLINDIAFLNGNKYIEIEIIQEGLLKRIFEEDSNSVLFVDDKKDVISELTILNINVKVKKIHNIHKKQKFYSIDIDAVIDFKKKNSFRLTVDYSKLHKCYCTKIKTKIDECVKEKLNFRETVLRLSLVINHKDFVKCSCEIDNELFFNDSYKQEISTSRDGSYSIEDPVNNNVRNVQSPKKETKEEDVERKKSSKVVQNNKREKDGDIKVKELAKTVKCENEKREDVEKENAKVEDKALALIQNETQKERKAEETKIKQDVTEREFLERGQEWRQELEQNKHKDKKDVEQKFDDVKEKDNEERHKDKQKSEEPLTVEEVKEMSVFLNETEKEKKEVHIANKEKRNVEKKVEEEKKKRRLKKIRENVPLTVMLESKGNEVCKSLIDKHSRYYRDFKEELILGCGGFGYVVKVRDKRFNIIYALKKINLNIEPNSKKENYVLKPYDDLESSYNSYIMEEAIMIAKLKHENIVRYYDAWVENNVDYYLYQEVIKPYEKEMEKKKNKKGAIEKEKREEMNKTEIMNSNEKNKHEEKSIEEREKEKRKEKEKDKNLQEKYVKEIYRYYKKSRNQGNSMEGMYLYILMEYCPGKTLREAIDCGFIYKNEKLIWALCKQILKGISYIHEMKIIHRDIKPSNIFLQINDNMLTAKIGDFGLTTRIDNIEINPSAGTVHYISPEQINGEPFDQKADMFSLGVVFFEMFHEPFVTSMERSIVLSNLLKGIFPEYMKSDPKKLKFLCCLLAINPQERPSAYNLLHENFPFSFEKDFTKIYNLVENRRNCDETHTIIRTLFEKFEYMDEDEKLKEKGPICFSICQKKPVNEDFKIRNKGKKIIIKAFKNRGAIYLITPIILLNKYYIDTDNTFIEEHSISYSVSKKKENKISNIYINTSKNNNVSSLIYLLDIYGNVITLRCSMFLAMAEYLFHNMGHYNQHNKTNIFFKFYTYGYTYKNQVLSKSRNFKKDEFNSFVYPDEIEKILYVIMINTRNIYEEEELYYLSVFANADILVSVSTLCECVFNGKSVLFIWSYVDLLCVILNECFDISENIVHRVSVELRKNSFSLSSKPAIVALLQKYKIQNVTKVGDSLFNLFQLKCETNKVDEYLNNLQNFLEDLVRKNRTASGSGSANASGGGGGGGIGNSYWSSNTNTTRRVIVGGLGSGGAFAYDTGGTVGEDNEKERGWKKEEHKNRDDPQKNRDYFSKMKVSYLIEKVKKINNFINTNTLIKNISFDLFLNYEEALFANEIVFYVISENKNREIIAYGGNFDTLLKKMNDNNSLYMKCYGVEINVEKIQFKIVNYSDKVSFNAASGFIVDKSNIVKNVISGTSYLNNLENDTESEETPPTKKTEILGNDKNEIIVSGRRKISILDNSSNQNWKQSWKHSKGIQCEDCGNFNCNRKNCVKNTYGKNITLNPSGRVNCSNPSTSYFSSTTKTVIHVERINTILIAFDLTKKLLMKNIPSYTYLDINETHKKKNVKQYKTKNIKFLITIKSDVHDDSFSPLNPIDFGDVVYKIYNFENDKYYYLRQKELLLYIVQNV